MEVKETGPELSKEESDEEYDENNIKLIEHVNKECLVLGECTPELVPAHIKQLLQFYDPAKTTPGEIIFLLVYISAIENGYITQEDYETMLNDLERPAYGVNYFQAKNVLKLTRKKPSYTKHKDDSLFTMRLALLAPLPENLDKIFLRVILTAIVSGDWIVMTLSPERKCSKMSGCSTVLAIGRYIINVFDQKKPIHKRFRKLNELAKTIAHEIFVPMRAQQNTILGKYPDAFLNRLPPELYAYILKFVKSYDRHMLSLVWRNQKPLC